MLENDTLVTTKCRHFSVASVGTSGISRFFVKKFMCDVAWNTNQYHILNVYELLNGGTLELKQ